MSDEFPYGAELLLKFTGIEYQRNLLEAQAADLEQQILRLPEAERIKAAEFVIAATNKAKETAHESELVALNHRIALAKRLLGKKKHERDSDLL